MGGGVWTFSLLVCLIRSRSIWSQSDQIGLVAELELKVTSEWKAQIIPHLRPYLPDL